MFLNSNCSNYALFYCLRLFLFNVLDVEEEQEGKNVLNMLAKAFFWPVILSVVFNYNCWGVFCNEHLFTQEQDEGLSSSQPV